MSQNSELPQSFCVRKLKVLADTTCLGVLEILMQGSKYVGELNAVTRFGAEPAIAPSQVLRQEGFVEATRDGKAVLYSLMPVVQRAKAGRAIALGCCLLSFD